MNNLQPYIFIIPVVALVLVVVLYSLLLKRAVDKKVFKQFTFILLLVAFLFNLAWEVLQIPLYKGADFSLGHILFCALASVADALMALLLYYGFALIYNDPFWIRNTTVQRTIMLMLAGAVGAILAERRHISLGSWAYDESMPIIPVVQAGLSPVLQFTVLPALTYHLSFTVLKKRLSNKRDLFIHT